MQTDVLVIGGGVTGAAAAYHLARAGADVALVDRHDLNTQASGRNAGGLHGQIQYEPFVELGEDWARSFAPSLALLQDSIDLWQALPEELGVDLEVKVCGGLIVASDERQLRELERKALLEREFGRELELLSRTDLQRVAPYVSEAMVGGLLCPAEGKANPLRAAPVLAAAATARGARIIPGVDVLEIERGRSGFRVETSAGEFACGRVLDCAGVESGRVAALVGVELPVEAHPIQVSVTEVAPPLVRHLLYFAGGTLTLKQAHVGSLLIGGGWPARTNPSSGRLAVDLDSLARNLQLGIDVVPELAGASLLRSWAGVCPGVADHRPIVGELPGVSGFYVSMFPFLGFSAGPVMGRLAAQLALGDEPERDLAPFSPSRFR